MSSLIMLHNSTFNSTIINSKLLKNSYELYLWSLTISDNRTKKWFLVDSIVPIIVLTTIYLIFVWIGPKMMKNRKPFDVDFLMLPYNFSMAFLNGYIFYELLTTSYRLNYSYICEPSVQSYHPDEIKMTKALWWYYISKLIEFSDTIFFILRKKSKQLTFLHVYHHCTMFPLWWIGVKWVPSGSSFFPAMVNSFIHVLMYSYYGLSMFGKKIQKYLKWKKYLTALQLCQFAASLIMGINGIRTDCKYPLWMLYSLVGYMAVFLILFGKFYQQEYTNKRKLKLNNQILNKID